MRPTRLQRLSLLKYWAKATLRIAVATKRENAYAKLHAPCSAYHSGNKRRAALALRESPAQPHAAFKQGAARIPRKSRAKAKAPQYNRGALAFAFKKFSIAAICGGGRCKRCCHGPQPWNRAGQSGPVSGRNGLKYGNRPRWPAKAATPPGGNENTGACRAGQYG